MFPASRSPRRAIAFVLILVGAGLAYAWLRIPPRRVILGGDTTWGPGSIAIDRRVVVPHDGTLRIQPGTTVAFGRGAGLIVYGGLRAIGTRTEPIRFTRRPGSSVRWGQIAVRGSTTGARIAHAEFEYAGAFPPVLDIQRSVVTIADARFANIACRIMEISDSSLHLRHSTFESVGEHEVIHGRRIPEQGHMIVASNVFHPNTGYRDIIDFSLCARPGPVPHFIGNHFPGGGDDGLDLDYCDAYVEGNTFANFNLRGHDKWANAISLGRNSRVLVTNNVFAFNDHAILTKDASHLTAVHNTFYRSTIAAISFNEPRHAGGGATIDRCIFAGNAATFKYREDARGFTLARSIVPPQDAGLGPDNVSEEPPFLDAPGGDYRLTLGTVARGAALPPPISSRDGSRDR